MWLMLSESASLGAMDALPAEGAAYPTVPMGTTQTACRRRSTVTKLGNILITKTTTPGNTKIVM
jgi:hypothetical protein